MRFGIHTKRFPNKTGKVLIHPYISKDERNKKASLTRNVQGLREILDPRYAVREELNVLWVEGRVEHVLGKQIISIANLRPNGIENHKASQNQELIRFRSNIHNCH